MAFDNDFLHSVGGHTGESGGLFLYQTSDTASTVQTDGYFDDAANRLEDSSVILAVQNTGGAPTLDMYHVDNSSGDITLTQETFA